MTDAAHVAPSSLPARPSEPELLQAWRYTFRFPEFAGRCRARYGSSWTLRLPGFPPFVVTKDQEVIRQLFTGDPLAKRHSNDLLEPIIGSRSLLLLDPAQHLARRRLELPAFHGARISAYADRIRALTEEEVDGWRPGQVVRVHARAQALTLRVILELVLGIDDAAVRARLGRLFDKLNRPANNLGMFMPARLARRSRWNVASRPFWAVMDGIHAFLEQQIAQARRDPALEDRDDVLAMLLCARDEDGQGLSDAELRDELVTLVAAGHETTATAIAWASDLLAHNPSVAGNLREDLGAGGRDYLGAVAKEVLRARTVVPISAARRPLDPIAVGEHALGSDTAILVDADGLHRDPELHPDPEAFRPERFLGEALAPYSYLPWGGGANRCLGTPLATLELELVLETVVRRTRLEPAGPPARAIRRGVALAPSGGGAVRIAATTS